MKVISLTVFLFFAAISSTYISAQDIAHEFSSYFGGGLGSLRYTLPVGDISSGIGGDFGIGYTLFRLNSNVAETGTIQHSKWGIHTGIGFSLYNAKTTIDNNQTPIVTASLKDYDGDDFDMRTTLFGYKETQRALFLNIPVMGQYHINRYYFMGGLKFGIPISGKFSPQYDASNSRQIFNEGYYPAYGSTLDKPKFAGYGEFSGNGFSDDPIKFNASVMLALEAGINWRINTNLTLYAGAYFDAGLNNIAKNADQPFMNFTPGNEDNFTTNSVLSSFEDKVRTMAVGVKVRIGYSR